jgi:hypothetical protein
LRSGQTSIASMSRSPPCLAASKMLILGQC